MQRENCVKIRLVDRDTAERTTSLSDLKLLQDTQATQEIRQIIIVDGPNWWEFFS